MIDVVTVSSTKFGPASTNCDPMKMKVILLLAIAIAAALVTAFAPKANATEVAVFNFEDSTAGNPPDFTSEANQGLGIATTITTNYAAGSMISVAGFGLVAPGDMHSNNLALGLEGSPAGFLADFNIPLFTSAGIQNMSL